MISQTKPWSGVIGSKQTVTVSLAGTFFYIEAASGPVFVRPPGGVYTLYYPGTGTNVVGGFASLAIYNPTANGITCLMVAGSSGAGDFIDKRLVGNTQVPLIINQPTFSQVGSNYVAAIPDLTGLEFTDPGGNQWLAIARVSVTVQALSAAISQATHVPAVAASPNGNEVATTIPDLSGSQFTDPQGNTWNATSRASCSIWAVNGPGSGIFLYAGSVSPSNLIASSPGNGVTATAVQSGTLVVENFMPAPQGTNYTVTELYNATPGSGSPPTTGIGIYSGLTLGRQLVKALTGGAPQSLTVAGNLSASVDGAPAYFTCFEIYQAIAPNSSAYQPPTS